MLAVLTQVAQAASDFNYNYDYNFNSNQVDTASAGLAVGMLLTILVVGLIAYLFFSFCFMKIFQKAGRKDAWAGFVPIYNNWVLNEVAGRPGWWALAGLIPFVGGVLALIVAIVVSIDLAKSFGKSGGFAALLILLPFIGYPMLAFGSAEYKGPAGPDGAKPTDQPPAAPQPPAAQPPQQPPVVQ